MSRTACEAGKRSDLAYAGRQARHPLRQGFALGISHAHPPCGRVRFEMTGGRLGISLSAGLDSRLDRTGRCNPDLIAIRFKPSFCKNKDFKSFSLSIQIENLNEPELTQLSIFGQPMFALFGFLSNSSQLHCKQD